MKDKRAFLLGLTYMMGILSVLLTISDFFLTYSMNSVLSMIVLVATGILFFITHKPRD